MTTIQSVPPQTTTFDSNFASNFGSGAIAPTGLDRFTQGTAIDQLRDQPSSLELLAMQSGNANWGTRHNIKVQAPVENVLGVIDNSRNIEISVRELQGSELGSLNTRNRAELNQLMSDASVRINRENIDFQKKTTEELRADSREMGYYNSPAHVAWSQAAEARTGGRIPASWWRENDPFGGTAGNGPKIQPSGIYPGVASRIAMGHDTDWTLGRQFGAGPLRDLNTMGNGTSKREFEERGFFGLQPVIDNRFNAAPFSSYSTPAGHPDWNVRYTNPW